VIRGSKAWEMIKAADASNKMPDSGYEYLLAKVEFSYGPEGELMYHLYQEYFKAYSSENKEYLTQSTANLQPTFIGEVLYPGQTIEGWIPFLVAQNDSKPVMHADLSTLLYPGLSSWFQLY